MPKRGETAPTGRLEKEDGIALKALRKKKGGSTSERRDNRYPSANGPKRSLFTLHGGKKKYFAGSMFRQKEADGEDEKRGGIEHIREGHYARRSFVKGNLFMLSRKPGEPSSAC